VFGGDNLQDMTCKQCGQNKHLDTFRGDSENGVVCNDCYLKIPLSGKPKKTIKNKGV
jgi:NAD-dependent SIR2 family protein deacetylase